MKPTKADEISNDPAWEAWVDCDECELGGDVSQADAGLHALAHARAVLAPERNRTRREREVQDMAIAACRALDEWYVTHNARNTTPRPESPLAKARKALAAAEALDKETDDG